MKPQTFKAIANPQPRAIILSCIDLRFMEAFEGLPKILGLEEGSFVSMRIGGGPTPLAYQENMPSRCKYLAKQLRFTCDSFPIGEVHLVSHEDCKYYTQFPCLYHGPEKEKRDLPLAGSLMEQWLTRQKIRLHHAAFINGGKEIIYEELQISREIRMPPLNWTRSHQHT